jgi:polar amino acid transport system substrate-binding protein
MLHLVPTPARKRACGNMAHRLMGCVWFRSWRLRCVALALLALLALVELACSAPAARDTTFVPATPGILRVATSLPAPGFWNGDDPESISGGLEYAMAREFATRWGLQLQIVDVPFQRIVVGDMAGADLALAQIAVTSTRSKQFPTSVPYMSANFGILVRTGVSIPDLATARSKHWVVEAATTELAFLRRLMPSSTELTVVEGRDLTLQFLTTGGADAALLDLPTALSTASLSQGRLSVAGQFVTNQHLAAALPPGSSNLEPLNVVLRNLISSGRIDQFRKAELVPALGRDPAGVPVIVTQTTG